jgi:hypothetical protein
MDMVLPTRGSGIVNATFVYDRAYDFRLMGVRRKNVAACLLHGNHKDNTSATIANALAPWVKHLRYAMVPRRHAGQYCAPQNCHGKAGCGHARGQAADADAVGLRSMMIQTPPLRVDCT